VAACFFQNPVLKGHAFWIDFSEPTPPRLFEWRTLLKVPDRLACIYVDKDGHLES
jgi:hypothetical protein